MQTVSSYVDHGIESVSNIIQTIIIIILVQFKQHTAEKIGIYIDKESVLLQQEKKIGI